MNAIKNGLLNSRIDHDPIPSKPIDTQIESKPIYDPGNSLDDDLDDIEVRPSGHKPHKPTIQDTIQDPIVETIETQNEVIHTTKKPSLEISAYVDEQYKVVCYYTNWAWYR